MQLVHTLRATAFAAYVDEVYDPPNRFGLLRIDDETVMVRSGEGTQRLVLARGQSGTTRVNHAIGAEVVSLEEAGGSIARADAVWRIQQDEGGPISLDFVGEDGSASGIVFDPDATEAELQALFDNEVPGAFLVAGAAADFTVTCQGELAGQRVAFAAASGGPS